MTYISLTFIATDARQKFRFGITGGEIESSGQSATENSTENSQLQTDIPPVTITSGFGCANLQTAMSTIPSPHDAQLQTANNIPPVTVTSGFGCADLQTAMSTIPSPHDAHLPEQPTIPETLLQGAEAVEISNPSTIVEISNPIEKPTASTIVPPLLEQTLLPQTSFQAIPHFNLPSYQLANQSWDGVSEYSFAPGHGAAYDFEMRGSTTDLEETWDWAESLM